jgi:hypothetical protein
MHVRARFARRRNAVDGADRLTVDEDDALVAFAHRRQIALDDERLAVDVLEDLEQRRQILIAAGDAEDAGAAIAVKRLEDDVAIFLAKGDDLPAVAGDQGRRGQVGEFGDEQLLRRVADFGRIVDHQGLRVDALEQMGIGDVAHVEGRILTK